MRQNSELQEQVDQLNSELSYAVELLGEDKTDFTRVDGASPDKVSEAVVEARTARGQHNPPKRGSIGAGGRHRW